MTENAIQRLDTQVLAKHCGAKDLSIPKYYRRVMVLDTETTGLIPKRVGNVYPPDEAYPYIMQFSWIIYNVCTNRIENLVDEYVNIPDAISINEEATKVHGITREVLKLKGKPILHLLKMLYSAYMMCDCIVAHNMYFDGEVIRKEMWRNREELKTHLGIERANMMCGLFTKKFNNAYHIDTFCTMMNTVDLCNIEFVPKILASPPASPPSSPSDQPQKDDSWKSGMNAEAFIGENWVPVKIIKVNKLTIRVETREVPSSFISIKPELLRQSIQPQQSTKKKFPRLTELYCKLFETSHLPNDLHNSIVDVLVCLRCFLKVRSAKEMDETEFKDLVNKYSR